MDASFEKLFKLCSEAKTASTSPPKRPKEAPQTTRLTTTITVAEESDTEDVDFSLIQHYESSSISGIIPQLPLPPEPRSSPQHWQKNNATKRRRCARAKKLQLDNIRLGEKVGAENRKAEEKRFWSTIPKRPKLSIPDNKPALEVVTFRPNPSIKAPPTDKKPSKADQDRRVMRGFRD
jgi:hypothetical protein